MGFPPNPPPGCNNVYCDNNLWLPGHTPSKVAITFSGIEQTWNACHPLHPIDFPYSAAHGTFIYYQVAYPGCHWYEHNSAGFHGFLIWAETFSALHIHDESIYYHFFTQGNKKCSTSFINAYQDCMLKHYTGGTALITW